jgi:hypothetical protein
MSQSVWQEFFPARVVFSIISANDNGNLLLGLDRISLTRGLDVGGVAGSLYTTTISPTLPLGELAAKARILILGAVASSLSLTLATFPDLAVSSPASSCTTDAATLRQRQIS